MDMDGSPEPIDFDFFDEDDKPSRSGGKSPLSKGTRPATSISDKQDAGGGRPDSVRSTTSSRSSLSVKIPTASTHDTEKRGERRHSSSDEDDDYRSKAVNGQAKYEKNSEQSPRSRSDSGGTGSSTRSRPKTSKGKASRRPHNSGSSGSTSSTSHSYSSSLDSKSRDSSSDYSTASDSNSDSVTDVSPMQSPINSRSPSPPRLQYKLSDDEMDSQPEKGSRYNKDQKKLTKESVRFKEPAPRSGHVRPPSSKQNTRLDESEAHELSMLLRAVLELEETPQRTKLQNFERKLHRPSSAKRPMSGKPMPHQRMNMSFSNDEVRRIDKDNQRLLQNIMSQSPSVPNPEKRRTKSARMRTRSYGSSCSARPSSGNISHSALLRQREQRRIEMENLKILKRIESAKPSSELQHKSLVKEFSKQQQYAAQVSKTPMRPSSAKRTGKAFSTGSGNSSRGMSKASSMQSLRSDFSHASASTATSSRSRSRPSSAKYGTGAPASRPAWDEHWAH